MFFTQIQLFTDAFWNWLTNLFNTFNFELIKFPDGPSVHFLDIILAFSFFALIFKFILFRH